MGAILIGLLFGAPGLPAWMLIPLRSSGIRSVASNESSPDSKKNKTDGDEPVRVNTLRL